MSTAATPDQADILAQNATLTAEVAAHKNANASIAAKLTELTSANITLTAERDALKATNATLATQVTTLTTERDTFKAQAEPLQKQLAALAANHGVRKEAIPAEKADNSPAKLNLTQQCLAAKGLPLDTIVHAPGCAS